MFISSPFSSSWNCQLPTFRCLQTSKVGFSLRHCKCIATCRLEGGRLSPQSPLSSWPAPTPALQPEGTTCGYPVNSWKPQHRGQAPRPAAQSLGVQGVRRGPSAYSLERKGFIYGSKESEVPSALRCSSFLNLLPQVQGPRGPVFQQHQKLYI